MAQEELTNADVEKIEAELEHRKTIVRKEAIEAVKVAREQGDLSENFEYYAAKRDKNRNESRIRYLERMLKTAKIISDESKEDEVGINNTVTLYFEEDDETDKFSFVTTVLVDTMQNRVGDRVQVKISDTAGFYIVIKAIENTTDTEDDTIRTY